MRAHDVSGGCLGRCCAAFPISVELEYLWLNAHRITDGATVAAMLVALTPGEARARLARVGSPQEVSDDREYFTCRHWHPGSRRCTIYERRPAMCRSYPDHQPCEHGCALKATS